MQDFINEYIQKTPGSQGLYERAARVMPGGVAHNMRYFPPYPLYIKETGGSKIRDVDGNEYIDLWMGHYTHILGHQPKATANAMQEAISRGTHWGFVTSWQVELAESLCRIIPCAEQVRFGVSGTEATMYAVRLARAFTGRRVILKARGGWHGANSELSVAIHEPMDEPESAGILPGAVEYTRAFSYNDLPGTVEAIRKAGNDLAAVVIEGMGQLFMSPEPGYLESVAEETRKAGALLILDEVITGFRLSLRGAQGALDITPDLCTMGKVLGGGMNISLVAGRKDIMELASPTAGLPKGQGVLMGGGTFSCMPLTMVASHAMVKYLEDNAAEVYPSLADKGHRVREGMEKALNNNGIKAKCYGRGSLFTVCFPREDRSLHNIEDVEKYTDIKKRDHEFRLRMMNKGVYTVYGGGAVSTAHTDQDIEKIILAVEETAREMAATE